MKDNIASFLQKLRLNWN